MQRQLSISNTKRKKKATFEIEFTELEKRKL